MNTSSSKRLNMLDGLRGMAIILVFLNHVDSRPIMTLFPDFLRPIVETAFSSGVIGVSFLFILSGFLMAYIYPKPTSSLSFLQKRYTRIFPLFITMTLVMTINRFKPQLFLGYRILVIILFALITHTLWVYIIKKINSQRLNRTIFLGFIFLQASAALWYVWGIMRKPPIFFNQQIPAIFREGTIVAVNATLTLPFGNYIPMIDGVYWSLTSEILFYILYPTICVPFIQALSTKPRGIKILFLLSLIPFFSALTQISKHILKFSMLFLPLFMYFALGILLGYLLRNKRKTIIDFTSRYNSIFPLIMFFIMVVLIRLSLFYTNGMVNEYVRILWTIPLFVFMIFILNEESKVAGFFSSKFLIFLGTVSYSIYLCHTSIVDGLHLIFKPGDLAGNIVFIFLSFGLTLAVATSLYYLLERPYFIKKASQAGLPDQRPHQYYPVLSFSIIILLFLSLFIAYQSNYNFFSYEKSFGRDVIQSPSAKGETDRISVLKSKEINIRLLSPQDNLGIVTASLSHISPPGSLAAPPELVFQIKPAASKDWLSTATYSLAEIGESKLHPFGFPVIKQAKNKEFDIRIYLTESKSLEDIYINVTNGVVFKTVNQLDKKQFISNPFKLIPMIANRVDNTFENREARIVFFSLLPFLVLTILLNKRQSRRLTKSE